MAGQKAVIHRRTDFTARHLCRFVCCHSLLSSDWLHVCPVVCTGSLCLRSLGTARWYETPTRRLHAVPGYWMSALLPIMSHAGCQLECGVEWRLNTAWFSLTLKLEKKHDQQSHWSRMTYNHTSTSTTIPISKAFWSRHLSKICVLKAADTNPVTYWLKTSGTQLHKTQSSPGLTL